MADDWNDAIQQTVSKVILCGITKDGNIVPIQVDDDGCLVPQTTH